MQNFLNLSAGDQSLAFEQTAAYWGMPATSVEKDFWVCWTLQQLFSMPELAPHLTFKGGTSLSKVWRLIDHFSEDIDLTIDRIAFGFGDGNDPGRPVSNKQLKKLRTACSHHVESFVLPSLLNKINRALGNKPDDAGNNNPNRAQPLLIMDPDDGDGQTLLFYYPSRFPVLEKRYAKPVVKIEMGARADPWPAESKTVIAMVAQHFPGVFSSPSVTVLALVPERTFWEKAMLLHEETFRSENKPRRPRMARHYYDLYRLIEQGIGEKALAYTGLFEETARHRQIFFKQSWVDYDSLKLSSLKLVPTHVGEWEQDYRAMQAEMFHTEPPSFEIILRKIQEFEQTCHCEAAASGCGSPAALGLSQTGRLSAT